MKSYTDFFKHVEENSKKDVDEVKEKIIDFLLNQKIELFSKKHKFSISFITPKATIKTTSGEAVLLEACPIYSKKVIEKALEELLESEKVSLKKTVDPEIWKLVFEELF